MSENVRSNPAKKIGSLLLELMDKGNLDSTPVSALIDAVEHTIEK